MNKRTAELLEKYFDTAFAAPSGIAKLRELILTLAMQGKLVEQDLNDPPASELLKEIEVEKQRLVKAGKIKKPKLLPEVTNEEITHEIPKSWTWVRFGDIAQHNSGKTLDKRRNTGKPRDYITTSNLYWGRFELDNVRQMLIRDDELEKCTAKLNDLLICEGGEAGRAAVWHFDSEMCFQNHVHRARFYKEIDPYFAYRFFEKLNVTGEINQHRKGVGISNMSSKALASIVFPLPPLPEQHRIVARIDQLMARCDELEKLRKEREEKRLAVHTAAIKQLLDAPDGSAWDFIQQHFGELHTVKENVAELRKAILQLAVMGRLVSQDAGDLPASELLKEIEAEKQRLVKEGKIKKPKPLPPINSEKVPYELPQGWEWVYLQDVFAVVTDGDHQAPPKADFGVPFLVIGNLNTGKISFDGCRFVPEDYYQSLDWGRKPARNDILYTVTGSYGIPVQVNGDEQFCVQRHVAILKSLIITPVQYIGVLLKSVYAFDYASSIATGIAQKTVPLLGLRRMLVALPSINEQHRIVARVDQLMVLCDSLEKQIDAATRKQTKLLSAVMAQV